MDNKTAINYLILCIIPLLFGCGSSVKEENKTNVPADSLSLHVGDEKYVPIDTKASIVTWKGANLVGTNGHTGYVHLSKGELMVKNGQLVGGSAEVDMNTIEDEKYGSDNNLIKHLKNPDFFDVEKFPASTIVITKVEPTNGGNNNVTANLTIKGITHEVVFPTQMKVENGIVEANAKLVIDRTKWDVRYKSGKFYSLLADQTIADSIEFYIKIVAKNK